MAVDSGDYQFGRLLQAIKSFVRVQTEVILELRSHFAEHGDVSAGAKEFLARPGDYDYLCALVHACFEDRGIKLLNHLVRIGIRGRIVER